MNAALLVPTVHLSFADLQAHDPQAPRPRTNGEQRFLCPLPGKCQEKQHSQSVWTKCFPLGLRQPSYHDVNHGDPYPRRTARTRFLVILAQTAELHQPGKGALHHPATRQHDETLHCVVALDNGKDPAAKAGYPTNQLTRVAPVRPKQAQARELTP